jgi:hypothetical protein
VAPTRGDTFCGTEVRRPLWHLCWAGIVYFGMRASAEGLLPANPAGTFTALRLYDLQGRIVWQGSVQGAETFEVPLTLPPGLYYLHTDVGTARLYLMP